MGSFDVAANAVRVHLVALADWLYGCAHRRTTFPITLRAGAGTQAETYIVCLECGRHFAYDWTAMRIARQRRPGMELTPHCIGDVRPATEMSHD